MNLRSSAEHLGRISPLQPTLREASYTLNPSPKLEERLQSVSPCILKDERQTDFPWVEQTES